MRAVTDADRAIGQRIQEARKRRGMSLKTVADAVIVSVQQMQKYEAGANRISAANLAIVANLLGVDLRSLAETGIAPLSLIGPSPRATVLAQLFDRVPDKALRDAIFRLVETAAGSGGDRVHPRIEPEPAKAG